MCKFVFFNYTVGFPGFVKDGDSKYRCIFAKVYDYGEKVDLSKGY